MPELQDRTRNMPKQAEGESLREETEGRERFKAWEREGGRPLQEQQNQEKQPQELPVSEEWSPEAPVAEEQVPEAPGQGEALREAPEGKGTLRRKEEAREEASETASPEEPIGQERQAGKRTIQELAKRAAAIVHKGKSAGRGKAGHPMSRRGIAATSVFFGVLFAALIGYLAYFTSTSEEEMINNSYNSRQEILLSRNYRGTIYSGDGEILAQTVVDREQNETRVYPYGRLFSHVVGYSTRGRIGVEALSNYYLINTHTSLSNRAENDMAGVKNPGDSVYTTLDVELQRQADSLLGSYQGAIVVTEVSTGKVLAMVSHPDFDPNEIGEIWDSVVESETSSVLLNRATQGLYPPGSTFKIVTALEYMRQNPTAYEEYSFQCKGHFEAGDSRIGCFNGVRHGWVDFDSSFANSCNCSFASMGIGLDWEMFQDTLDELLFGESLPMTMPHSKSSVVLSEDMTEAEKMQTAFGQGKTQVTPMHLHMITSAIAKGGILMKPYVVDHVENDEGQRVKSFEPSIYGRLMTGEEAAVLRELMTSVVENGNGKKLSGEEYTVAGKTGSAEFDESKKDCHAWFTGFAPAQDPEICITIILEKAGNSADYAIPIAKGLFRAYFDGKK